MRILIFTNWFPPIISGSSYYASSLAQALTGRGHEVVVVTLDWGEADAPPADRPFPIHRLPIVKIPKLGVFYHLQRMGFSFTPANCRRLKRLIEQYRPQLLHHVNHIFDSTFLSTQVGHACGLPVVGSITTPIQHQNPWMQAVMGSVDRLTVGVFGVRRWDGIVSLDRTVHEYVGRLYGAKTQQRSVVIPFGVSLDSLSDYDAPGSQRSDRFQILMAGHIHPFRNPVQLVRAMPLILTAIPDCRLLLAGRIDLQEPVKAARELGLTSDQVQFLGATDHREVIRLMKASHVLANWLTGPYPSLGTAPMEAMLCGTPVISDLPENLFGEGKLRHGENILLVDSRDPPSIADTIIRLYQDPDLRQRIAVGGRRFVLEHLSWNAIAEQMEQFYERVLSGRSRIEEEQGTHSRTLLP